MKKLEQIVVALPVQRSRLEVQQEQMQEWIPLRAPEWRQQQLQKQFALQPHQQKRMAMKMPEQEQPREQAPHQSPTVLLEELTG